MLHQESTNDFVVILTTAPSGAVAQTLARGLVTSRLAGCVNILSAVQSVYRWQDEVEQASECQRIIKTRQTLVERVFQQLAAEHPYDAPELLVLPLVGGSTSYLSWLQQVTGAS